ncbi:MAG: hypothetical protein MPJ06_00815 [Nitrosopumilus sp.]|nr:hypothetical protein [Nitrosopumilus sp.]MDA7942539.1 hypothetical protein [Nitrosopumilus sp.]
MSHTGVDVIDFLLYTMYPVAAIFLVEIASRPLRAPKWAKLWTQAAVSFGFAIHYMFILQAPQNFPLTALVMAALGAALLYQGRRARIAPEKTPY